MTEQPLKLPETITMAALALDTLGSTTQIVLDGEDLLRGRRNTVDLHLRSAAFQIENTIYLCYKTSYLNDEVNHTEPSPQ